MKPNHVISSIFKLHSKLTFNVWLSVDIVDDIRNPLFTIEYNHLYESVPFTLSLTRKQLVFLTRDNLGFGDYCGHISLKELPNNRFVVRDNKKMLQKSPCVRWHSPPIPINGEFFKDLQRVVKEVLDDLTIAKKYVNKDGEITLLKAADEKFIKQLIITYIHETYSNHRRVGDVDFGDHFAAIDRLVASIIEDINTEKFNSFLASSNMAAAVDVDVRALALGIRSEMSANELTSYENVSLGGRWVAHLNRCEGTCTDRLTIK